MGLHAIVLAAGFSTRMGQPKALLELDGRSFFARALSLAEVADGCVVITGAISPDELRAAAPAFDPTAYRCVQNPRPEDGQFSSMVIGARALPSGASALVLTIDRPRVRLETVLALRDRWVREPETIHTPRFEGTTGHPIVLPAALIDELRDSEPGNGTLRSLVRSGRWPRARIEVDDPGTVENVDTPHDYDALSR